MHTIFYKEQFIRTRAENLMENEEQIKNKAEPGALSYKVFLENDAEAFQ